MWVVCPTQEKGWDFLGGEVTQIEDASPTWCMKRWTEVHHLFLGGASAGRNDLPRTVVWLQAELPVHSKNQAMARSNRAIQRVQIQIDPQQRLAHATDRTWGPVWKLNPTEAMNGLQFQPSVFTMDLPINGHVSPVLTMVDLPRLTKHYQPTILSHGWCSPSPWSTIATASYHHVWLLPMAIMALMAIHQRPWPNHTVIFLPFSIAGYPQIIH